MCVVHVVSLDMNSAVGVLARFFVGVYLSTCECVCNSVYFFFSSSNFDLWSVSLYDEIAQLVLCIIQKYWTSELMIGATRFCYFFIPEFFFFIAVHRNVSKISRISRISTEELIGFFIRLRSNSAEICSYQNPKNTQAIHNYIWTRMNDDYLIFCSEKIRHRERNEHSVVLCFCSLFIACSHRPHNQRAYMQLSNWTYGLFMYDLPFTELRLYVSDVWWEWYENPLILFLCFWTCVCLQLLLLSHSSQITIFYYTNGI